MQVAMSLFSLVVKALLLARTYWPVVTVVIAFIAKLASGDTSGLPEALSAIVAAIAAVRSGGRAEKAEKAIGKARASGIADVIAVAVRKGSEDLTAATIGSLDGGEHVKLVPVDLPNFAFTLGRKNGKPQAQHDSMSRLFGVDPVRLDDPPQVE